MSSVFKKIASVCALGLIFLSQFVPTAYVEIKAMLLVVGSASVLISMLNGRLFVLRWQVLCTMLFIAVAMCYSMYGLTQGNPGAIRVLSIWLLWPIVYLLFTPLLQQEGSYRSLASGLVAALFAVTFYSYMYLGWVAGIVPDFFYVELDQGQNVGFYDGFIEYNLYSISSLIFLIPFYLHYLLEKYKRNKRALSLNSIILILAAFILVLLTGRRVLLLILFILPFVIIFSNRLLCNDVVLRFSLSRGAVLILGGAIFYGATIALDLSFGAIFDMFLDGFDFSNLDNISASERMLQLYSLIDGWLNSSVLFGAGNGAAASVSRSDEFPWAYELTYVYLLFSTGLAGVVFYFGWYGYGLIRLRNSMIKRPDLVIYAAPMLTGSIAFCIASATNPYFGKFDYLWIVLLPFLISGWATYQKSESSI